MTTDQIIEKLKPWFAKHRRPAWKPVVQDGDGPPTAPKFCGAPWIGSNAPWPKCGQCKQPMQLFLQLDLGNLPKELGQSFGMGLLQLFCCTRDDCPGPDGYRAFEDHTKSVRVIQPKDSGRKSCLLKETNCFPSKRIVGWERFIDLPNPNEHEELGLKYTFDFDAETLRLQCPELSFDVTTPMNDCSPEEIAQAEIGDKLAGWPSWVQRIEYPNCPRCGLRMVYVFQVDSEFNIPFMFGDMGCGHITQCPEHKKVVAFGWACS